MGILDLSWAVLIYHGQFWYNTRTVLISHGQSWCIMGSPAYKTSSCVQRYISSVLPMFILLLRKNCAQLKNKINWPFNKEENGREFQNIYIRPSSTVDSAVNSNFSCMIRIKKIVTRTHLESTQLCNARLFLAINMKIYIPSKYGYD